MAIAKSKTDPKGFKGFLPYFFFALFISAFLISSQGLAQNNNRRGFSAPSEVEQRDQNPAQLAASAQSEDDPTQEPNVNESQYAELNPETGEGSEIIPNFDFPNADIMEVAKALQKLTGINIITGDDVKGKVSILAPSPITVGDAWKAFLSALHMKDYTVVKTGKFYKIIRKREAKESPIPVYTEKDSPNIDAFVTRVISLKYINVDEVARNFRIFLSRDARITKIEQTNTVIITDTGSNINRLAKIIEIMDVEGHKEVLEVVPVRNASASEIAGLIEDILNSSSPRSSRRSSRSRRSRSRRSSSSEIQTKEGGVISQIIADERTNSLVVLANAAGLKRIRQLVKKLDRAVVGARGGRIHVYYLQHANAEETAETLQRLAEGSQNQASRARSQDRFSRAGSRSSRSGAAPSPSSPAAAVAQFEGGIKITADPPNNALVISASPSDFKTLKQVIAKIDIPRDQVFVEAVIMELSLRNIDQFSVNILSASDAGVHGFTPDTGFTQGLFNGDNFTEFLNGVSGLFSLGLSDKTVEVEINDQTFEVPSVSAFINAVVNATQANVLSRPQIMTLDNEEAEIQIKDNIPIVKIVDNQGVSREEVDTQEVGLKLKLTPAINKVSNLVRLDVEQSFSTPSAEQTGAQRGIRTSERSAVTKVVVKDGDTVAIGGLMRENKSTTNAKVPLLGDIPLLGWLFRKKRIEVDKTNLILFLTPRIIKGSGDSRDILEERLADRQEFIERQLGGEDPYKQQVEDTVLSLPDYSNENEGDVSIESGTIGGNQ
jgi:general secretion pathway protein D